MGRRRAPDAQLAPATRPPTTSSAFKAAASYDRAFNPAGRAAPDGPAIVGSPGPHRGPALGHGAVAGHPRPPTTRWSTSAAARQRSPPIPGATWAGGSRHGPRHPAGACGPVRGRRGSWPTRRPRFPGSPWPGALVTAGRPVGRRRACGHPQQVGLHGGLADEQLAARCPAFGQAPADQPQHLDLAGGQRRRRARGTFADPTGPPPTDGASTVLATWPRPRTSGRLVGSVRRP